MVFCVNCGGEMQADAKFCGMCGRPVADEPSRKHCTKCDEELDRDVLFCGACGTKQYVPQLNKRPTGELLASIANCSIAKMQILKTNGTLQIYDHYMDFIADTPAGFVRTEYSELLSVTRHSIFSDASCIKFSLKNGKTRIFRFSAEETDFLPYLINLISDYII